ncbi:hypothetical protein [uncultured Aliiroseovarius sp.]|uniref:hypothetical protein n=1 Tax=uncultured Aliiroseovarius sp. TaxID=1658783 RepID=UPI00259281E4|nr:hypothetical protein [uncultured Aliiroseovarius sp.]
MSDPVSNTEIEDVLSSIRRLISESKASDRRDKSVKAEKLVLTPAFRVHDDGTPAASTGKTATSAETDAIRKAPTDTTSPDEPNATAKAASGQPSKDKPSVPVFSHRGSRSASSKGGVPDAANPRSGDKTQGAPAAGFEDKVSRQPDAWEPEEGEETTQSDVLMFHAARLHAGEDEGIVGANNATGWPANGDAPEAPFVAVDDPDDDKDLRAAAARQTQRTALAPSTPSSEVEIVGDDTDIIDEEVVQAMVARLVREELQGEVGEKITQSIRRFVRREIERALTLKQLE